jgi:hypothetical protein
MVELPLVLTSQLLIIPSQGHLQVKLLEVLMPFTSDQAKSWLKHHLHYY